MVFYFESDIVSPSTLLFMGIDKNENEDLIKWGWPEDVWFHVDKVSSAHVYLRLRQAKPTCTGGLAVLLRSGGCSRLTFFNRTLHVPIQAGPPFWSMQVINFMTQQLWTHGPHMPKGTWTNPVDKDFRAEREKRDMLEREDKKKLLREQKKKEEDEEKRRKDEAELRSYNSLMNSDSMAKYDDGNDSDDFM